ncbi:MAG: hypothetical protein ABR980_06705 [Ignavibacteriaceae bacterium]|jgi:hypothetical protein
MNQMPKYVQHLFWDINVETFNPLDYPEYTISRVLEFGNEEAATWIKGLFPESEIKKVIKSDKRLSPKSANFWAIMFGIPIGEIAALKNNGRSTV